MTVKVTAVTAKKRFAATAVQSTEVGLVNVQSKLLHEPVLLADAFDES